jgi:aspartyl-tRNA(Asn)/glutamyl-tRNA(Gln) amidotransferase subunit B
MNYLCSVGMEVHAGLSTKSKMFCRCEVAFGGEPNTRTCPVCLGLPGALPMPNRKAIEMVIKTALALNCTVPKKSIFHRKNYFYPDLSKGYQTSQYEDENPLGYNGYIDIPSSNGSLKRVNIKRVHLEEDTGKLMHLPSGGSGVDYNRAGTPLMEIVTDFPPDITNPEEAKEYLSHLRHILMYLNVCDGKMEESSLRCEPNISIRLHSDDKLGTKTELKNLNSFRAVQMGIDFEIKRQSKLLEAGETVAQETRGWNEKKEESFLMRIKESENDYRYFPCPDLVPMEFSEEYIEEIRASLPELPLTKFRRYKTEYGLSDYDAHLLVDDRDWAEWFEKSMKLGGNPKSICNWMNSDFAKKLNEEGKSIHESNIKPEHLVELTSLIADGTITSNIAKKIFADCYCTGKMPKVLIKESGLNQTIDDTSIKDILMKVIEENPDVVIKYREGQKSVAGFFVGQVMKHSGGRANPNLINSLLNELIGNKA